MQLGFNPPTSDRLSDPTHWSGSRRKAIGYDSLTLTDRIPAAELKVPGHLLFRERRILRASIWIGGESGPAVLRAAYLGDASNDHSLFDTLARYCAGIARLHRVLRSGRPRSHGHRPRLSRKRFGEAVSGQGSNGRTTDLSGSMTDIAGDFRARALVLARSRSPSNAPPSRLRYRDAALEEVVSDGGGQTLNSASKRSASGWSLPRNAQ